MYINGVLQAAIDFEKTAQAALPAAAVKPGVLRRALEAYKKLPLWARGVGEPLLAGGAGAGLGALIGGDADAALVGALTGAGGAAGARWLPRLAQRIKRLQAAASAHPYLATAIGGGLGAGAGLGAGLGAAELL